VNALAKEHEGYSMDYKQAIIVRSDLKLPKGKLAAQVGMQLSRHA